TNKPPTAAQAGPANGATLTKTDAVKQALANLGNDAMPLAIRDHIKSKFGIDMDPNLISNYKSTLLKKAGGRRGRGGRPKRQGVPATARATAQGGITLEDIRAVKDLAERIGADKVRQLVDVLYR